MEPQAHPPQPSPQEPEGTASDAVAAYRQEANFARVLRLGTPLSVGLLGVILATHLGVEALELVQRTAGLDGGPGLFHGAKIDALLDQGQWWRLMSMGLLHGGWLHLAFNAYALFVLGPVVERLYGSRRFLVIYTLGGLAAALASAAFTAGVSVGASGAIFALLGALVAFGLRHRQKLPPKIGRTFGAGMIPWVVINLVIGFIPGLRIDNAAHIGGLLGGVAVGLAMETSLQPERLGWRRATLEVCFVLSVVALTWGAVGMVGQMIRCAGAAGRFLGCYPVELLQP